MLPVLLAAGLVLALALFLTHRSQVPCSHRARRGDARARGGSPLRVVLRRRSGRRAAAHVHCPFYDPGFPALT